MKKKKTILFLGASITQGIVSSNFVKLLKNQLGTKHYKFVNHGIAGYESYNVLKNINKTIKSGPDYVILLVGTNDVLSSLDPELAKLSRRLKKIPYEPSLSNYSSNITRIVRQLKNETDSKIAISSLPVLGENFDSTENRSITKYNAELKKISENEEVAYLPINERQKAFINRETNGNGRDYINRRRLVYSSLILHYFLFMSYDSISKRNGYLLLTDGIHQNSSGAKIIAQEIEDFILSR